MNTLAKQRCHYSVCVPAAQEAIMKMIQKRGPQPPEETDLWACVSRLKDKSGGMGEWSVAADLTGCLGPKLSRCFVGQAAAFC